MIHIYSNSSTSSLTNVQDVDVQPNAVDLRVDRVFQINDNIFIIDEEQKVHRGSVELSHDDQQYWHLQPGSYEIVMENVITMGEREAGWVITRSTLNRNGCFITSGLYDSGYNGAMAGCLHVTCGPLKIKKGTRVGQFLLFNSETLHLYNGSYGFKLDGQPKPDEAKYHR